MKILQVIPWFAPIRGGDVNVCYHLSKELASRNHDVTIVTTDYQFDHVYAGTLEAYGVRVLPFRNRDRLLFISPRLNQWLETETAKYDIIHLHQFRSYQSLLAHKYAIQHAVPYVVQPHASTPRLTRKRIKWLFDVFFGHAILDDASGIIAVSREEERFDKQLTQNTKITVIYNGIDLAAFSSPPSPEVFRENHGIDGTMILYLGRISHEKGIEFAIRAVSKVAEDSSNLTFIIAGADGGYRSELERLVERLALGNVVRFIGSVDETEKAAAYAAADLFIHTVSYMGGVGLAPLEAILSGTPVIVTKECGEIIKSANCGYFVEFGDIDSLAAQVKHVLENPDESKKKVERGIAYITRHFSWPAVTTRIEHVYDSVINEGQNIPTSNLSS